MEYHFFSDPGPRIDQLPGENLLAEIETRLAFNSHSCSLSGDLHDMSLNIDMKMIRPVNYSGFSFIFWQELLDFVAELQCGESWEIFHSNSIGSPSIVSKALYCDELLNHVNLSSQTVFDCGFSFIFPRHHTESENTQTFACERLMTSSSLTRDNVSMKKHPS